MKKLFTSQRSTGLAAAALTLICQLNSWADDKPWPGPGPMPKIGYIIDASTSPDDDASVVAYVGRRNNQQVAERAALRMMNRLLRWYPQRDNFYVTWDAPVGPKPMQRRFASFKTSEGEHMLEISDAQASIDIEYHNVTRSAVRKAARMGGTFRDLTRYGAVDDHNPVFLDLGLRSSYEEGCRAVMRTLARRLQCPFTDKYEVAFQYREQPKDSSHFKVQNGLISYDPSRDGGRLESDYLYINASRRAIIKVGNRSGRAQELTRWGATKIEFSAVDNLPTSGRLPKRGYSVRLLSPDDRELVMVEANIGRRSSESSAKHAVLRMLAKLNARYPRFQLFRVNWEFIDSRQRHRYFRLEYNASPFDKVIFVDDLRGISRQEDYSNIDRQSLRRLAQRRKWFH